MQVIDEDGVPGPVTGTWASPVDGEPERPAPESRGPVVAAGERGYALGEGLFESLLVRNGHPFGLSRHLARLRLGAERLRLRHPGDEAVRNSLDAVLAAAGAPPRARVRIQLSAVGEGLGATAAIPGAPGGAARLVVTVSQAPGPEGALDLVSAVGVRNERSPVAGLKSTSYLENLLILREAVAAGASEAVVGNSRGVLAEAACSNLVLDIDGRLVTPRIDSGCLPGITRGFTLEWARDIGLEIEEESTTMADLVRVDTVLLTNAVRGVRAARSLDGRALSVTGRADRLVRECARRLERTLEP